MRAFSFKSLSLDLNMLFGNLFYKKIAKLSNWQQALFALVITTRMYPNFKLYCDSTHNEKNAKLFKTDLDLLWKYLEDHEDHIDFTKLQEEILDITEPYEEEDPFGKIAANLACQGLLITFDSILNHNKTEAQLASDKSIETIIKYSEVLNNKKYSDDEIVELPEVQAELDFQVQLIEALNHKRSDQMFAMLKELADNDGYSNIGIPLN